MESANYSGGRAAGWHRASCGDTCPFPPLRIRLDDNEAFPTLAVAFYILLQALQEALLKLQDLLDMHAQNQRLGGCDMRVGYNHVVEFVRARREDRGALVDLDWID